MENCIFCKIIKGEIEAAKIWEDDKFVAVLDAFPNTKGMTLVMPLVHCESHIDKMSEDFYADFLLTGKKVAKILEKTLGAKRIGLVIEGTGVNHAHIKLYPLYKSEEEFKDTWPTSKIHFEKYEGYISTQHGPQADLQDLKKFAEEIRQKNSKE